MKLGDKNVLGGVLKLCCNSPTTGYFRDGYCRFVSSDQGSHTVCAKVTKEFLEFTKLQGNDLTTPRQYYDFPGLKPGDKWCLCASRWLEAEKFGVAPPVVLEATNEKALDVIPLQVLQKYADPSHEHQES